MLDLLLSLLLLAAWSFLAVVVYPYFVKQQLIKPEVVEKVTEMTHPRLVGYMNQAIEEGKLNIQLPPEVVAMLIEATGERVKAVWNGLMGKLQAQGNEAVGEGYVEVQDAYQQQMGQEQVGQLIMQKIMSGFMKKLEKM